MSTGSKGGAHFNERLRELAKECAGLEPQTCVIVGQGIPREEIKALVLSQKRGLSSMGVTSLAALAAQAMKRSRESILDQSFSRQEILRLLVDRSLRKRDESEIRKHRRQRTFFKKLDRAVQSYEISFAHSEHRAAALEFLKTPNLLRQEILALAGGYRAFLASQNLTDPVILLREFAEALESGEVNSLPVSKVIYLCVQLPHPLEKRVLEALGSKIQVEILQPQASGNESRKIEIQRWHSLMDAAYAAAEECVSYLNQGGSAEELALVISDVPAQRRSLMEALKEMGAELEDPRDPTLVRRSEAVKRALMPIQIVGRGFRREDVLQFEMNPERIKEIQSRGIRQGLMSYQGQKLSVLYEQLKEFETKFIKKVTVAQLKAIHLQWLATQAATQEIMPFFVKLYESMESDLERIGLADRKAPLALWLDRIALRIQDASPLFVRLKNKNGIRVYRMGQVPAQFAKKVIWLGLPSDYISGAKLGDHFLTQRDREILRDSFDVRAARDLSEERKNLLNAWIDNSAQVSFHDFDQNWDGSENQGSEIVFLEAEKSADQIQVTERGPHPRFAACFDEIHSEPAQQVILPFEVKPAQIKATELDAWSRCPFRGLVKIKWKLEDIDEPELDLRALDQGIILHEAVKLLLQSRDADGVVRLTLEDAVEKAWMLHRPRHFYKGGRLETMAKRSLIPVLTQFMKLEMSYYEKAKPEIIYLDNQMVELQICETKVFGQPDRVDRVRQGLFIMDFKSGVGPMASEMVDAGYRLQLPFYALAATQKLKEPWVGVQFITLSKSGNRARGIFFTEFASKEIGFPYYYTKANKSLLASDPTEVFKKMKAQIEDSVSHLLAGEFSPKPRIAPKKECPRCPEFYLCGRARLRVGDEGEES